MQGKISQIDRQRSILRILATDGRLYVADRAVLKDLDLDQLNVGDSLQFVPAGNRGEPRVERLGEDRFESITLFAPPDYRNGKQQFNNPYNFVRAIKPLPEQESEFKKAFVPHDSFQGMSGTITCRLNTLTPFFTPDSRTIEEDTDANSEKRGHKRMDYCSTEMPSVKPRAPMIHGSTIRGVIRSVFEAATNSSFTAIDSRLERLIKIALRPFGDDVRNPERLEIEPEGLPGKSIASHPVDAVMLEHCRELPDRGARVKRWFTGLRDKRV